MATESIERGHFPNSTVRNPVLTSETRPYFCKNGNFLTQLKHSFPLHSESVDLPDNDELECIAKKIKLSEIDQIQRIPDDENIDENVEYAAPMTCYHLRPPKHIDRSCEVKVNPYEYIKETADIDGFTDALETMRQSRSEACGNVDRKSQYPKVVFLGTGSCIPNKTRNVSSILVHTT